MNLNGEIIDFLALNNEQIKLALLVYGGVLVIVLVLLIIFGATVAKSLTNMKENTRQIDKLLLTIPDPYLPLTAAMYQNRKKSVGTALLLALSFGVIGAHHIYLGNKKKAVLSALFFWTGIPGVFAFFDALAMPKIVSEKNLISLLDVLEYSVPIIDNETGEDK